MKRFAQYALILFFAGSLVTGCRLFDQIIPKTTDPSNPIKRVAILPLQNDTTDIEGPNYVRNKLVQAFKDKHYNVKPITEVDRLLRDKMGATLGGQLKSVKPQKLKKILDVEGVVFGTLMDFDETTTGIYNARKVRGKFKLLNCLTNETFWKNGIGIKSQDSTGDLAGAATTFAAELKDKGDNDVPWVTIESDTTDYNAGENLIMSLGKKLFKKATDTHLENETEEMIRRITETLPSGPGMSTEAAQTAYAMPEINMPAVPSFGYMDYGPKDFSAIIHSTSVNKKDKKSFTSKIPIAKAGEKYRMEMDFGKTPGSQMPAGLSKMVTIHRGDKKLTYSLYPNQKKYLIFKETDENYYDNDIPKVEKTKIGREKVDGHPTDKYKVKITYQNGTVQNGFIWNARDLDGMTIKSEVNEKNYRFTTILKKISLKKPSNSRFNIPTGYAEANNMMELIMDHK